jgi:cytochrome c-type biogenesis protein
LSLDVPGLAFALTAGVLSVFSPCGYALLPGYVSYYLGSRLSIVRALSGGLACTLGLVTVFTVIGGLSTSLGKVLTWLVPQLNLLAGLVLIVMGAATLRQMRVPFLTVPSGLSRRTGLTGFYFFGLVYGLAGVGCSAPIFISVVVFAASRGLASGVLTFVAYALGMGVPLMLTSVLVAQANEVLLRRISEATPRLQRVSGAMLVLVGLYLFYFHYVTYIA